MNILILTGRFGQGHYSTALSLKQEIQKQMEDVNIQIVDIVDYIAPKLNGVVYSGFNIMVRRASKVYNFFYKNTIDLDFNMKMPFTNIFIEKIENLIYEDKPDIIISTLPFCSRIVSQFKSRTSSNIPLITCITDISVHNEWINPETNVYLVATETVKANLIKNGTRAEDIVVIGIPVKDQFKNISFNENKHNNYSKNLLIMGGGLGLIPLEDSVYNRLNKVCNLNVTVILGNNEKEYNRLRKKYHNIEVIGYTDRVHEYMANADLIISKAGGITLFEAIYSELPILALCPFLEQERNNANFIEYKNIGEVLWDKNEDIVEKTLKIIYNENKLKIMRENMRQIKLNINDRVILEIMDKVLVEVA